MRINNNYITKALRALILLFITLFFWKCSSHKKPNIVFILIDDLGWTDLGYTGSEYYETPAIDRLASKGMVFTNAYSNAANCAPTRASLLTGQYTPRHGIFTVASPARGKSEDRRLIPVKNSREPALEKISIAESLKKAGYTSAAIGKWHIGHTPEVFGFDFGIDRNDLNIKGHFHENGDYLTDLLTDEAVNFIKENNPKKTNKPLFWHFPAYLQAYKGMTDESRDPKFRTRPVSAIRKGDWKLLLFHEEWVLDGGRDQMDKNNSVELYNLMNDLGEKNNLAQSKTRKRDELLDELIQWQIEIKAPLPTVQNPKYINNYGKNNTIINPDFR